MAHIEISRPHALGPAGARETITAVAAELVRDLGVRTAWHDDVLHVEGKGVSGRLHAAPDAFHVSVDLALGMRPLRPVLRREIAQQLDRLSTSALPS